MPSDRRNGAAPHGVTAAATADTLIGRAHFLQASLSAIPDYVYAFDRRRRFAYANPAMLALFGLTTDTMIGRSLDDLDYPRELASRLNDQIDHILATGETVEDEVFYRSPTGHAAYFAYLWGPVRGDDGTIELVVGVSRDTSERRGYEEALRRSEARLRAATDLVGIGIYAWDPVTGALEWDNRLRAMWGLPPDAPIDMAVFEGGIHPDDRARVRAAIDACADPAGDGLYSIQYRVIGRCDGVTRHIASSGRTTFLDGRPVGFIGAAIDVTARHEAEAQIRSSEALFRSFAEHSSNLLWIGDTASDTVLYRSAAFERIWGVARDDADRGIDRWLDSVHPDDRSSVRHALDAVAAGDVMQYEYRIVRPGDGAVRRLRDISFPIPAEDGAVTRIGGIAEDLTQDDAAQVYIVSTKAVEARRLANIARSMGYHVRAFASAAAFLDVAAVLSAGCVIVDLRTARADGLAVPRELRALSIALPCVAIDTPGAGMAAPIAAMKAGATDYLIVDDDTALHAALATALAEGVAALRPVARSESANARLSRLSSREREVLTGLVAGHTNKQIGKTLGISPRTVELHRAQVMNRLDAANLAELVQIALLAGITIPLEGIP